MQRKTIVIVTLSVFASEIVWQIYKRFRSYKKRKNHLITYDDEKRTTEVMFFSEESALCRTHLNCKTACSKPNCAVGHVIRIADYINSATESLNVCVYFLTCQYLSQPIINASTRGVVVRLIMDSSMAENSDSQTLALSKAGIKIRIRRFESLMHHKFAIVDGKLLISGSTNWTMNAFFGNYDNIIVTNQQTIVKPFLDEFEKMWRTFDTQINPN